MPNILKVQGNLKVQGGIYITTSVLPTILIWTGGGTNNNWSTVTNWNLRSPINFDIIQFAGSTRLTPFNDLAVDTLLNGIAFNTGAGAFTLSGNRFILNTDSITNNSSNIQTINNDIILGSNAGTINCNTGNIDTGGTISGSGSLTKIGASTLSISGSNNTYTGNTFINTGTISVLNNNVFGTGTVFCSGGAGGLFISPNAGPVNTIINNPIFINGQRPSNGNNITVNKTATFNGLITIGPNNITNRLNVANNATMTINGGISGLPGMAGLVTMNGTGTYILSSVPIIFDDTGARGIYSDTGTETVIIAVSGNKFQNILTSGILRTDVPFAINDDIVRLGSTNSPGRVNLNGNSQVFRNIALFTNTAAFSILSGNNIFNNSSTFANLTANSTANSTYTGSISGNINLIKTGTSTLTLSGSTALGVGSRYTGFTAISGTGPLVVRALSSDPSNKINFASFPNTNTLTVDFGIAPIINETFVLLPGRTINLYPNVLLTGAPGRAGAYNSSTSTLSITS